MAATEMRQDLHQTSTGVGHHFRPGYYFPSSNFRTVINEPLPAVLARKDEVATEERFKTTTGVVHDRKHTGGPYGNRDPLYKKAPGHWKVHYNKDLHEKLGHGGFRKPLTMGNQTSEMQDMYRAEKGINMDQEFRPNPQGFVYNNHAMEGPSKKVMATTQNDKLRGQKFFPKDKGVLRLNDIYLTTTQKDHRAFKPKEVNGYAKKDVPTYWECEEYPKAWGHGLTHNPLPKDTVPRERLPMRDPTWFKTPTRIPRLPNALVPVPHMGLKTLQAESYQTPSDVKMKEIYHCPVDTPFVQPQAGPSSAFTSPQMYKTEYQNVGSRRPITV